MLACYRTFKQCIKLNLAAVTSQLSSQKIGWSGTTGREKAARNNLPAAGVSTCESPKRKLLSKGLKPTRKLDSFLGQAERNASFAAAVMNIKHELCPRTKERPQTSPEKAARQGRPCGGPLRTLSQKPEPQTNLGPIWFLALLSGLRTNFPQPCVCGRRLAVLRLCSQHSTLFLHFPTRGVELFHLYIFPKHLL